MKDVILVCENKEYMNNIGLYCNDLMADKLVVIDDVNVEELPKFNLVTFILSPFNIANKFFLEGVKEILKVRKNSRSILFVIDDVYKLNTIETNKVIMELEKSLAGVIKNPKIKNLSSKIAAVNRLYKFKNLTLEDIQKDKSICLEDESGFLVSGKNIKEEQLERAYKNSGIEELIENIKNHISIIKNESISVVQNNILVCGPQGSGKSTFIKLVQDKCEDISFKEVNDISNIQYKIYDKMIIVLDLDNERSKNFIEKVCSDFIEIEKVFIINKIDEFMLYDSTLENIKKRMMKLVQEYCSSNIYFISSYYLEKVWDYKNGNIDLEEIVNDNVIVLMDEYGIPIMNNKNKRKLIDIIEYQANISKFNECLEELTC